MSTAFSKNEIIVNNFRNKFTLKHIRKVIKDDSEALEKEGFLPFLGRWWKRKEKFSASSVIASFYLGKILNLIIPVGVKRKILRAKLEKNKETIEHVQIVKRNTIKVMDKTLSVIINTKDSPPFFREIIEKYSKQIGFKEVEIIIVDSGSIDNTLEIAREFGCKIVEIKPEEFRHGRSRNIGIEVASGDFIVNTVSDAVPATLDLTYKVARKLEGEGAAAVSVRQIPRFDADLFAVWSIWQHYKYIFGELNQDIWIEGVENFNSLEKQERRKLSIIDDVFVMHDAKKIKKVMYDNDIKYAEDLLLSINYINKGYKIGILQSEAVIHSHSRPEEYFFKRYFVDANVINDVFKILPNNLTKNDLTLQDSALKKNLVSIILLTKKKLMELGTDPSWTESYLNFFKDSVGTNTGVEKTWNSLYHDIDQNFIIFLKKTGGFIEGVKDVEAKIAVMTGGTLLSEYFMRYGLKKNELTGELLKFKQYMEGGI